MYSCPLHANQILTIVTSASYFGVDVGSDSGRDTKYSTELARSVVINKHWAAATSNIDVLSTGGQLQVANEE